MNTKSIIEIFRGDDSDALGYQTIVGTIHTDLDLTGCKAVFRYLGFFQEFDPIPEDGKLTIVIPSASSMQFPPGFGYASLKVYDIDRKVRTFTNRIPVFVKTMTPCRGGGEFDVEFSPFPELEPLKIFIGPNADDFDQYTGFISKIIDRASLAKYGLVMLADAMGEDGGDSGKAASPAAVKAAYDAVIGVLTDSYYTAEQTEEAIDRVAAYYITRNADGDAFETKAQLDSTTVFYSGGSVRVPTRNDYCVVLADETHDNAEYRYIYAVAEGQTTGSWQPQFPVEGVMTVDQIVTKNSQNPVSGGGVWSAIWGALSALPTGFTSLYDWCVAQFTGKFAQYYPDGSVKSTTEFTQGIKYNAPDTVNRTITVKPFCNTGTAENDNSNLEGRVVIPPFVDAQGNGYISDDGTRFKVVGVSGGNVIGVNYNLTDVIAPTTVTTLRFSAFAKCADLTSVSLPAAESIWNGAFKQCIALTSVSLPAAESIGKDAFVQCDALTSVAIPSATSIGDYAFEECTLLSAVDFGDTPRPSVPSLGPDAFSGVPSSCKIIVPYTQYDAWIAASGWSSLPQEFVRHAEKADKPTTFTTGNLAKFDSSGNPTDSGKKPSDFQDALSAQQLANIAAVSDALAFDATHPYAAGDPVVYNGTLYTFTTAHTGAWTGSDVLAVDIIARLAGKLSITSTAPQFVDEDTVYQPGRLVVYNGSLYVCTQQHYGPWNADHFSAQDVVDEAIGQRVGSKVDKLTVYTTNNLASIDEFGNIADSGIAKANVAQKSDIPYSLGTPIIIDTASSETVEGETVNYGAATLADRTANIVQVTAATALDELRITFPAATNGKVRDFGLRVEIGTGSAALAAPALVPVAPTGETIKIENADGTIPALADGTATAKGVTLLYFSENAPGVFVVKGEQVEEVA